MEGGDQRRYRADRDHLGLGSRAELHYLTTSVATGKTTLPCDDNGLNRLIKACVPVHCDGTVEVASRKTPAVVEWRRVWETQVAPHLPKVARVSIKGLGNALQCEAREYLTSFKNHLKYGLIALYARPLRAVDGLSLREAETTVARRLAGSPYFKGVFPDNTAADPDAPCIETHHDAGKNPKDFSSLLCWFAACEPSHPRTARTSISLRSLGRLVG